MEGPGEIIPDLLIFTGAFGAGFWYALNLCDMESDCKDARCEFSWREPITLIIALFDGPVLPLIVASGAIIWRASH
jgi:hypothetical protein